MYLLLPSIPIKISIDTRDEALSFKETCSQDKGIQALQNVIRHYKIHIRSYTDNKNFPLPLQPPEEGVNPKNPGIQRLQSVELSTPG